MSDEPQPETDNTGCQVLFWVGAVIVYLAFVAIAGK